MSEVRGISMIGELEVKDTTLINNYNRLIALAQLNADEEIAESFRKDARRNNINYVIFDSPSDLKDVKDGDAIIVDNSVRYYALVKGEIVGMEIGYRTGDAISLMCGFGRVSENLDGGI